MSQPIAAKVSIDQVEQALMQAIKSATEEGYKTEDQTYTNSSLNAVDVYSTALQRILTAQRN